MKKLIATTAAALLAAATVSAGDGLKVSGHIQGGVSGDLSDMVASENDGDVIGATWVGGDYWGGSSRGRFQAVYDGDNGGVEFRFQPNLNTSKSWFDNGNVKWAMAYANFFDGAIVVEGGKLHDRFTSTGGWDNYSFQSSLGARLVLRPIEGLYLTVQGSDYNPAYYDYYGEKNLSAKKLRRHGHPKFDASLLSMSAKFANDTFFVTGGAHFSGIFYGSFGFTGIENLTFVAEAKADYAKHWEKNEKVSTEYDGKKYYDYDYADSDVSHYFVTNVNLEYNADPVLFGVVAYAWIADDDWHIAKENWSLAQIIPAVQFKLSDIVALRAESTLFLNKEWEADDGTKYDVDSYATITPSVVFNASEKANVNVWLTLSTDTDQTHHATGVGVQYNF